MIEFANDGHMLTIGKLLKNERERQDLTLEDVSEKTKINVKFLAAIEQETKEDFPGDLYYDLFCKSYADALGLEYAKIKAGTFSSEDEPEQKAEASKDKPVAPPEKSKKGRSKSGAGKISGTATEKPAAKQSDDSRATSLNVAETPESTESDDGEERKKPDWIKMTIGIAGAVFGLFLIVMYFSLTTGPSDDSEDPGGGETEHVQPAQDDGDDELPVEGSGDDSQTGDAPALTEPALDTFTEGPVRMYPESLEVVLSSSEEFWASIVSDGDTVFQRLVGANTERFFSGYDSLVLILGRWEFIKGTVYGYPIKPMATFHRPGNNSVRLNIKPGNWESFIDSSKEGSEDL